MGERGDGQCQQVAERTVLITGGTSGLGRRAAERLATDPAWHVVITGRDRTRGEAVAAQIGAEAEVLDLGSLDAVRRFADAFAQAPRPALGAVVCNAGVQHVRGGAPVLSADGHEATFAVNHLGHFLLVALLLDQLRAPARVVVVSSNTHDSTRRTGMPAPRYRTAAELASPGMAWAAGDSPATSGRRRYSTSKLCNVLFAYEAQRRLGGRGVTFNAFDPGMMPGTGLARDYPAYQRLAWRFVMPVLTLAVPQVNTPRQSGDALARLVSDPALDGMGGRYWIGGREGRSSAESHDRAKASDLWETSLTLTGVEAPARRPASQPW